MTDINVTIDNVTINTEVTSVDVVSVIGNDIVNVTVYEKNENVFNIVEETLIAEIGSGINGVHNHNLADLQEKSYNSLTDKPFIPAALSELNKDINFDERYYVESEIDAALNQKAEAIHTHAIADISGVIVSADEINYLVGTNSPIQSQLNMKLEWVTPPLTRNNPGTPGQIAFEDDYFFICVAQDLWARTILTKGF